MFGHFVGLIKEVAKVDAIYKKAGQGVDLVIHPMEDGINFWLAFTPVRDNSDYEAEPLDPENDDIAFVYECSLDKEEMEVCLHNAFVDVEEFLVRLQEKNNA